VWAVAQVTAGAVFAALALLLSFNAFVAALSAFSDKRDPSSRPGGGSRVLAGVGAAVDAVLGVALLVATAAGMAAMLVALKRWGLMFADQEDPSAGELFVGLVWHAADTVPLVDVGKAWNWEQPWKLKPGGDLTWLAGSLQLLLRLAVALGLARVVAKVTERLTG
jgi:hypothetical protein